MYFEKTDPEFREIFDNFLNNEVKKDTRRYIDEKTGYLITLAALMGCGGTDCFEEELQAALERGLEPNAVKEMVYQGTDYLGMGRMMPFLKITNKVYEQNGISLMQCAATVTAETRLEKGAEAQRKIFGRHMLTAWEKGTVNRWLAANCFGDFYTRQGLDLRQRELVTFCFLMAQGGCESQLISHAKGNFNMGNSKEFLENAVLRCLPYIGYPRSLNAIAGINKAAEG